MASYDRTDFDRMRQEAVARARDMQRRAQGLVGGQTPQPPQPETQSPQENRPEQHASNPPPSGILSALLGSDGKIDEEKALIGMLIYILYKNGADVKLMLALGYLLL